MQASRAIAPRPPAERDETGLAVGFSRECDIDLPRRLYTSWIPKTGSRAIVRALTEVERIKLEGRAIALDEALQPFDRDETAAVEAELAAMFSGFRAMRQQGDDAAATVEVTRHVLREFPLWAIAKTCLMIARNEAEIDGKPLDRRFTPNDTEIYAVAAGVVKLRRDALATVKALLVAPVEPPPPPRPAPPHDWHVWAWRRHCVGGDSGHAARVLADIEQRRARRASAEGTCGNG